MSHIDKEYLARLLVHGVSQTQAASALGCTQGYISQLVDADPELGKEIGKVEAKIAAVRLKKDEKLETIEKMLITRTSELVESSDSLGEAVTALQRITDLRERQQVRPNGGQSSGQVLELNLGKLAEAQLSVTMGENRVIMNIGGKDMARAPSSTVKGMAEEVRKAPDNEWQRAALPTDAEDATLYDFPVSEAV